MSAEEKQGQNTQNRNTMTKRVVITTYVESSRPCSSKQSEGAMKKTKPRPHFKMFQAARTHGCDRRAQLLAYSRQLRNANAGSENVKVPLPRNQSRPRTTASSLFSSLATAWHSSNPKNV